MKQTRRKFLANTTALALSGMPVASQWAINVHMMNDLRKRYL
jgi:hypothetical protein